MRNYEEQLVDRLFLLYIISKTNDLKGEILGATKLQKLCFLEELAFLKEEMSGLHFGFFRFKYGPFSKDLLQDHHFLMQKKHIYKSVYKLTPDGEILLDSFVERTRNLPNNIPFFKILDNILDNIMKKWGSYTGMELKDIVYKTEILLYGRSQKKIAIEDIPRYYDILVPEQFRDFDQQFLLPDELIEDFGYALNKSEEERLMMKLDSGVTYEERYG